MNRWNFCRRRPFLLIELLVAFLLFASVFPIFLTVNRRMERSYEKMITSLEIEHRIHRIKAYVARQIELQPDLLSACCLEKRSLDWHFSDKGSLIPKLSKIKTEVLVWVSKPRSDGSCAIYRVVVDMLLGNKDYETSRKSSFLVARSLQKLNKST